MDDKRKARSKGTTRRTRTPWEAAGAPSRAPLAGDVQTEVCVIGAGFSGLSTAYFLSQLGRGVVLIDSGSIANGESAATTAHLTTALDDRYFELERLHGAQACRLAAASHAWAVDQVETISREERIACDFARVDGYLFLQEGDKIETLQRELAAARRCGLPQVELLERAPLAAFDTGPALHFPRQAQCHPVRYLAGLADAVERLGGRIFCSTEAAAIDDGPSARVRTRDGHTITAKAVVVATNVPFNDRVTLHTRLFPYRSYVIAARVKRNSVTQALYWDTGDCYHYVRIQPGEADDLLIIGGEDHKTGQASDSRQRFDRLESWARPRFPSMGAVEYSWSGQIIETADNLAFIGRNPGSENVYVITGDSGNGTTHGTLGGRIVADLIAGRENPWAAVYSPSRAPTKGAGAWLKENLNVAAHYSDYVTPGDVSSTEEIAPGSGAVLRRGLRKVAAYRAPDGAVQEFSAICPHLGGIVCWNAAEKSWDCPLHGSRFDTNGEVLNGPARSGLRPLDAEPQTPPEDRLPPPPPSTGKTPPASPPA